MSILNNKNILITGGAGFIGSNLALHIQNKFKPTSIVVIDKFGDKEEKLSNGNLKYLGNYNNLQSFKHIVLEGDINDTNFMVDLFNEYNFSVVFHLAAISDTTAKDGSLIMQTNVNAYKKILNLCIKHKSNLVYSSSAATYGKVALQTMGGEEPNNIYGFSKLMMDNLTLNYIQTGKIKKAKINVIGLRYFNVYGAGEFYKGKTASTILQFGLSLLRGENPKLFVKSDEIKRDFVYIKDVIDANIKACLAGESGIFNVGTAMPKSFVDVVDTLQRELGTNKEIEFIPNPYEKQYQFYTKADITQTTAKLGYVSKYSLGLGIKDYIDYIKKIHNQEQSNKLTN
jgi:ADP-L-glycero-D-manno-heptose 6-epimerase